MLMMAFAVAAMLTDLDWVYAESKLAVTVGLAAAMLAVPVFVHLILSYPTGRLVSRLERGFVSLTYAYALVYALPLLLSRPALPERR